MLLLLGTIGTIEMINQTFSSLIQFFLSLPSYLHIARALRLSTRGGHLFIIYDLTWLVHADIYERLKPTD